MAASKSACGKKEEHTRCNDGNEVAATGEVSTLCDSEQILSIKAQLCTRTCRNVLIVKPFISCYAQSA